MLNFVGKGRMRTGDMHSFKSLPIINVLIAEEQTVTLRLEDSGPGWCHLNQVIWVSISSNKTRWHHVPLDMMMHWERYTTSVKFLPKNLWPLESWESTRETQTGGGILQNKKITSLQRWKPRLKNYYRLGKTKATQQLNQCGILNWIQDQKMDVSRKTGKIQTRSGDWLMALYQC